VTAPFDDEAPEVLTRQELGERFGGDDPKLLAKSLKLGLLIDLGDERYEAPSPSLLAAAEEVMNMGIPIGAAVGAIEKLSRSAHSGARAFVSLFLDELWKPFDEAGRPDEDWPKMIAAIERLRPIAVDAFVATFRLTLTEEVDKAFGEVLERAKKKRT